jgi:hypothetical protein
MKPLVQSLPRVNGALNTVNLVVVKGDDDARVDRAKVQDEAFTEATPQFHAPGNVRACVRAFPPWMSCSLFRIETGKRTPRPFPNFQVGGSHSCIRFTALPLNIANYTE